MAYEGDIATAANPANANGSMGFLGSSDTGASGQGGWTAAFGLAGLGIAAFGQNQQSKYQNQVYQDQQQQAQVQIQENNTRQQQMHLVAQRQGIENLRNTQKTIALAQATAVGQGAQFGSGTKGGQGAEASQSAYNALGLSQNLQIGDKMFGLDSQIDQLKIQQAQAESQANTSGGLASIGGDIMKAAPALAQLATLA